MRKILKDIFKNILKVKLEEENPVLRHWVANGKPVPPPQIFKHLVINYYANKYETNILIETGTYLGDTIQYCKNIFKQLITIELDYTLFENAKNKFVNDKNIFIYQGDSGVVIEKVLLDIEEPCLFWLDGHYSEGITAKGNLNTPIIQELNQILDHPINKHVILIDDARLFTGKDDYPTLNYLREFVKQKKPNLKFVVEDDIIRIFQKENI